MPAELMPWAIIWNMAPLMPIFQESGIVEVAGHALHTPMPSST